MKLNIQDAKAQSVNKRQVSSYFSQEQIAVKIQTWFSFRALAPLLFKK